MTWSSKSAKALAVVDILQELRLSQLLKDTDPKLLFKLPFQLQPTSAADTKQPMQSKNALAETASGLLKDQFQTSMLDTIPLDRPEWLHVGQVTQQRSDKGWKDRVKERRG